MIPFFSVLLNCTICLLLFALLFLGPKHHTQTHKRYYGGTKGWGCSPSLSMHSLFSLKIRPLFGQTVNCELISSSNGIVYCLANLHMNLVHPHPAHDWFQSVRTFNMVTFFYSHLIIKTFLKKLLMPSITKVEVYF